MTVVDRWRSKMTRGELIAPRVLAAGAAVGAESVEATRRQVHEAKAAGADFLKIFSEVREPQWRAILEEARALRMPVCGHIPGEVSLLDAATAGQQSNEHLTQVYEACSPREKYFLDARKGLDGKAIVELRDAQEREVLESFDQLVCDRTAAALAPTKQVQVPTLVLAHSEARGSPASSRDDPRWRYLRSDEQARWQRILKTTLPEAETWPPGAGRSLARSSIRCMRPVCASWPGPMRPCRSSIQDSRCTKSSNCSSKPD
jgi:hypothetical protein